MAEQTTNTLLQNPNDILSAITSLAQTAGTPPPAVTLPAFNFTVPTNLPQKYQEFLQQAANSPDIINYYQQLLDYTKGDLTLATQQLEQDYQTGVRQTKDVLGNTLKQIGLTFTGESNSMLDQLNKRGIALTQEGAKGPLTYAGGGQAATEVGQMQQSQQLRQEAEQRSAAQNIENQGLKLQQGLTSAGQTARNQVMGLQQQKQADIFQRANIPYQSYLTQQQIDAAKAAQSQSSSIGGGGSSGPVSLAQRQADFAAAGGKGDLPVGFEA